jgi:hypothetical protein
MPCKVCNACGQPKPVTEYHKDRSRSDGRRLICKACAIEAERAHYKAHREMILQKLSAEYPLGRNEREKDYRARNREAINARRRAWREANKERINEKVRAATAANREEYNTRQRERYTALKAKQGEAS